MKNLMIGLSLVFLVGCGTTNAYERPTVRIVGEAQILFLL